MSLIIFISQIVFHLLLKYSTKACKCLSRNEIKFHFWILEMLLEVIFEKIKTLSKSQFSGLPIIQASIERAEEDQMPVCWRNMFSSICFLRILVKLMKDKPWRAIWLVKYKATNIFKKAMLVKHGMFQLYLLKVIKLHARFLGRPWRKSNMDIVSAIYR